MLANTDVELRRRISNAKRTPAIDLPANQERTQGVSSNAGYVPQDPRGLVDSMQNQLCLLKDEVPARTEPPNFYPVRFLFFANRKSFRSCVCAHITQSSVAPPNHQREANPGD